MRNTIKFSYNKIYKKTGLSPLLEINLQKLSTLGLEMVAELTGEAWKALEAFGFVLAESFYAPCIRQYSRFDGMKVHLIDRIIIIMPISLAISYLYFSAICSAPEPILCYAQYFCFDYYRHCYQPFLMTYYFLIKCCSFLHFILITYRCF